MANMQRSAMVTELNVRGWSRFTGAELERYLDWALQDIYSKVKLPRSALSVFSGSGVTDDEITFLTISGVAASAELIQQILAVYVKYSGELIKLDPADPVFFTEVMWPNLQASSPTLAAYPTRYFVYDLTVVLYPKMQAAVDMYVHHLLREDVFSGATDTTALPERFDKVVLAQAETYCARRAHMVEEMLVAQQYVNDFLLEELGMAGAEMYEKQERVLPYRD